MWIFMPPIMSQKRPELVNRTESMAAGINDSLTLWTNTSAGFNYTAIHPSTDDSAIFEVLVAWINKFLMPLIIFGGLMGNSLSFIVFVTSHLKIQSCSVYLAFLNVVDSLFLLCLLTSWLGWFEIYLFHQNGWCQVIVYASYVTSFLSAWGVICFTVERYIVVYHPLKKQVFCTRYKAIVTVVCLSAGALLFYSFSLFIHGIIESPQYGPTCMSHAGYDLLLRVMTAVDTVITLLIPCVVIILLNCAIAVKVWDFMLLRYWQGAASDPPLEVEDRNPHHKSSSETTSRSSRSSRGSRSLSHRHPHCILRDNASFETRRQMHLRTTRSLLIVSTVFIALNLPSHSIRIHMVLHFLLNTDTAITDNLQRWQHMLLLLSYMNYSANFLLYCACSWSFRAGLRRLCIRFKKSCQRSKESFLQMITIPRMQSA